MPRPAGGWYSPFPPLLSLALVPFAAAGFAVDTNQIAGLMGGLSVIFVWAMLRRLDVTFRSRLALTLAWAFGSRLLCRSCGCCSASHSAIRCLEPLAWH